MSCKKIERFLAIFAIFPLLLSSAKTQPSIKNVIKSQDGVISLRFFLPDDRYGVLHHSNSLSKLVDLFQWLMETIALSSSMMK